MTTEIAGKDSIKLNILNETLGGAAVVTFRSDSGAVADYAREIHHKGGQVFRFGSFTVSEESAGNFIKIRPNAVGEALTIDIKFSQPVSGKSAGAFRSATKSISDELTITDTAAVLELAPGGSGYTVKLTNAGDADREELREIQQKTDEMQQKTSELSQQKRVAAEKLRRLEAEYSKDHEALQAELDGIRERLGSDGKVLEFYKDKDITPTEELLKQAEAKLNEAEAQIKLFIEAKQQKTIEIETEIRSNKV